VLVIIGILLIAFVASALLTGLLRRYALAHSLIDIPNARSSHQLPTPRGGGLAIVIVFLVGLLFLLGLELVNMAATWSLFGASIGVAFVGFLDDHGHVPAVWRLLIHFIAAAWGLFWLGGLPSLTFLGYVFDQGWLLNIMGLFYLVWLLNLYNFMDGIDGLASIEAITVCLGAGVLSFCQPGQICELALLAIAVAGFLLWNFPPAKIFMGDAGSGFLGIVLGLFSIQVTWVIPHFFWSWLILLGVFVVDASWTLARRFLRGEKIFQAHRSHAYQYAARHYGAHRPVVLLIGAVNLCWLMPIALLVGFGQLGGLSGLIMAYFPLVLLAIKLKAGAEEKA